MLFQATYCNIIVHVRCYDKHAIQQEINQIIKYFVKVNWLCHIPCF